MNSPPPTTSTKPLIWRQEINIFGNKVWLDTTGTQKMWLVKIYDSYKNFKSLKIKHSFVKRPFILKLFILAEIAHYTYSNFNFEIIPNEYNNLIQSNPLFNLFKKDNPMDYLANIALYGVLGKTLFITNKKIFYSIFLIGIPISYLLYNINNKAKIYVEEKVNIKDFDLCDPSVNIIPKMILSYSIMSYLNYFLRNDKLKLFSGYKTDKKVIFMFIWVYTISKILQFTSNFTTETINLASVDGSIATLISSLFINKTYFLKFLFIFYFNPYAMTVWFSAKNNVDEDFVTNEYKNKNKLEKIKIYMSYTTLVAFSNMLKIYF